MAQRRVPIGDVEAAIAAFKTKAGPNANVKLLRAFAAAFTESTQQRSQIIDGLDRMAASRRLWPIASARRTRPCKTLRTRTLTARGRPARTIKKGCYGISASSTIAARPSLMSARCRR